MDVNIYYSGSLVKIINYHWQAFNHEYDISLWKYYAKRIDTVFIMIA